MEPVWNSLGCTIHDKPKGCDVQLSFITRKTKTNLPLVLRLDGIYYDTDKPYKKMNNSFSHHLADSIIYQSQYSQDMCEIYLKPRKKDARTRIVYNGIKENWAGDHIDHEGINIVVMAKWRRHKRLKEIIDLFLEFEKIYPDSKLHIFGKLHNNKVVKHPKLKYHGMVKHKEMVDVIRMSDMSFHLSKRDWCPSSVVEAIGAGIPVISTNACGGAAEMCKFTEGCIVCEGDYEGIEPCPHYREEHNKLPKQLKKNLIEAMVEIAKDRRRVVIPEVLRIEHMAKEYLEVMKNEKDRITDTSKGR